MSEKANYNPAPQGPAPPIYEQSRDPTSPGPEIQLQSVPQAEQTRQYPGPDASANGLPNPPPQMYPPQQYAPASQPPAQQSQYSTSVPLHALQRTSQVIDCPVCHQREMTRTLAVNGKTTHGWAAVLCCCACVGCIPYFVASLKDVNHMCGKCDVVLAKYHNSGHIEIYPNPVKAEQKA
ncbi:LITAF-like zinc ribbon domain-containing protein [Aspergillus californicus]